MNTISRRGFLAASGACAALAAAGAEEKKDAAKASETEKGRLIISAPMLQNAAETSVGVAFAVSDMANGFVDYSLSADMKDSVRVKCGGYRVTDMNDVAMLVRLRGLKPATKYYYRIGADRIDYQNGYKMKRIGRETDPKVYSFTTAGARAESSFAVINDTHANWKPFEMVVGKVEEIDPACVVWNGDATNCEETIDRHVKIFLDPDVERKDYASSRPYSLAIGKRGQNIRLTTKLTGWHIEVKRSMAAASFEDQKAEAVKELAETFSVSTAVATQMADAGFLTVEGIVEEDETSFIAATGLDEVTAKGVYAAAQAVAALTRGESIDE